MGPPTIPFFLLTHVGCAHIVYGCPKEARFAEAAAGSRDSCSHAEMVRGFFSGIIFDEIHELQNFDGLFDTNKNMYFPSFLGGLNDLRVIR